MSRGFNKGCLVQYIKHSHYITDKRNFEIGRFYIVKRKYDNSEVYELYLNGESGQVFDWQVKKINDNAINRLLYPEAFSGV